MKILFALGDPYPPQYTGGAQSSSHEMALELMKQGHQVSVICRLLPSDFLGWRNRLQRKISGRDLVYDQTPGYRVYRQWDVARSARTIVDELKPDVVLMQIGNQVSLAAAFRACHVPTLIYLRNVEMRELGGDPRSVGDTQFIANSHFTARRFKETYGIESEVIPPLFIADKYKVTSRRKNITYVNPYPEKGTDIALEVARRCPEIPFCFVESWSLGKDMKQELVRQIKTMPNVRLRRRTPDMKKVYADAKAILMPSRWEEAWGRVASEAHYSGIPVIASNRGGLPESVGPGGVTLEVDSPIDDWVNVIRRFWTDEDYYSEKSAAAIAYAKRPEINPVHQTLKLIDIATKAVRTQKRTAEHSRTTDEAGIFSLHQAE